MKLSQFKFKLPEEQIALYPHSIIHSVTNDDGSEGLFRVTRRDDCRLMVLHRKSQTIDMYKKDKKGKDKKEILRSQSLGSDDKEGIMKGGL